MSTAAEGQSAPAFGPVEGDEAPELSRIYAEALVGAASNAGNVEPVLDELDAIVSDVLRAHPQFAAILASPLAPMHQKDRILVDTFEGRALPTVVRFLRVLNEHGRLGLLPAVARRARAVWNRRQNRVPVSVRSAVPLDEGQQATLRDRLARLTNATPLLEFAIDPGLIGGLVVQVGDDVYDASLRSHLAQLRRSLIEGKTHEIQSRRDYFSHPA